MSYSHSDHLQGRPRMAHAIRTMPRWKWKLLGISLVLGCVGLVGEGASLFLRTAAPVSHTVPGPVGDNSAPSGFNGYGQRITSTPDTATPQTTPAEPTLTDKLTPFMSKFGFSLFVGVVVGLVFRTFVRITVLALALIVAAGVALSFLHINVDMTVFKADTSQASSWLMNQGYRLRDLLFGALPSSTAATVGFFLGFKKR